jgi:hypothetical protein
MHRIDCDESRGFEIRQAQKFRPLVPMRVGQLLLLFKRLLRGVRATHSFDMILHVTMHTQAPPRTHHTAAAHKHMHMHMYTAASSHVPHVLHMLGIP